MLLVLLGFQVTADEKYVLSLCISACSPMAMQLFFDVYILKEATNTVGRW